MQISSNSTGMRAGLAVLMDKDGREHCVVVVKGTFRTDSTGHMRLADEQRPIVEKDEHLGDPATTSVRYECDFALEKPLADVIVVGKAMTPGAQPTSELKVRLEVQERIKEALAMGDRCWVSSLGSVFPSDPPVPFTEMPLTYERAFGGQDDSRGPDRVEVEPRNLIGVGFQPHCSRAQLEGLPLPNIERPDDRMGSPRDRPEPIGFGVISRNSSARLRYAGTYDRAWLDDVCPFLPADFDSRYFQCAPEDQRFPHFKGGEVIRCVHMALSPVVRYTLPAVSVPIVFEFVDRQERRLGALDTVTLEPHLGLAMLVWRASVPLGKKLNNLRQIHVGERPAIVRAAPVGYRKGKPVFARLGAAVEWLRRGTKGKP